MKKFTFSYYNPYEYPDDSTGEMVPLMKWVMKYDCFNLARVKLFETFATGHIRILSREYYNLLVNL